MYVLYTVLGIAIALFCFWAVIRGFKFLMLHEKHKVATRVFAVLLALSFTALSLAELTIALYVIHIMVVTPFVMLANLIVKRVRGDGYATGCKPWKTIYYCSIIPIVAATAVIVGGYVNMNKVVATEYTVYTNKSIRADGYTLALIADVHYGISVDGDELNRICDEISARKADIVLLCGDIVDESATKESATEVFAALGGIDSAYGVYYVYGNHDRQLYSNDRAYTEQELERIITDCGITVLRDEATDVCDEIVLVGREDAAYKGEDGRKPIDELLGGVDKNKFVVTLDHQPKQYDANAEAGTDLLLSGHTHNGQIWPMNWILALASPNEAMCGYTRISDNAQAYVTAGFAGWGFTVKTSARAEYVILTVLHERE